MSDRSPPPARGAGALIALSIVAGTVIGVLLGEPTLGLLGGAGVGAAIALLLYLLDRRR